MWAEWMKDFDLSVTPEDIERYEEMQRIKKGKPIKKKNQPKIIGNIKKTHKKSWKVCKNYYGSSLYIDSIKYLIGG